MFYMVVILKSQLMFHHNLLKYNQFHQILWYSHYRIIMIAKFIIRIINIQIKLSSIHIIIAIGIL